MGCRLRRGAGFCCWRAFLPCRGAGRGAAGLCWAWGPSLEVKVEARRRRVSACQAGIAAVASGLRASGSSRGARGLQRLSRLRPRGFLWVGSSLLFPERFRNDHEDKSCRVGGAQAHLCRYIPKGSWHMGELEQQRAAFSAPRVAAGGRHQLNVAVLHRR